MKTQTHISLKPYNTFGIDVMSSLFIEVFSEEELREVLQKYTEIFVLGGGSNMLLTQNIAIPVVKISLKGITIEKQDDDFVWITAQAGENWHQFVTYCITQGYGGLENLSLIPGNVGTTPIQNIGAYGVEIQDVMETCQAINIHNLQKKIFTNKECKFAYRESVFKNEEKGNYIIISVTFRLTKRNHILHTEYGDIQKIISEKGIENPTPKDVSNAVIYIRKNKLPDPKKLGNSGSFFKNPIIKSTDYNLLVQKYPKMPHYPIDSDFVKIPAGWLIDTCGLKGYRKGDAGVHQQQALVLVNYGTATGNDILQLAYFVQETIFQRFGILLEFEVNVF